MDKINYNYVIFGTDSELYNFSFSDLDGVPGVVRIPSLKKVFGKLYPLHRLHFMKAINNKIRLPLKSIWRNSYFKNKFNDDKPICFIFMETWSRYCVEAGVIPFYKKKYPNCKCVWFATDLLSTIRPLYKNVSFDIRELIKQFDYVFSFDQNDCKEYGLFYHPLVFSSYKEECNNVPYSDIYFLGKAKNRLPEIIEVFEFLRTFNLKLDFYLTGVSPEDQVYKDEINYISCMSYIENLKHVSHTRCLLEIMQQGGRGFTQRGAEAVCLNKKLLTNNKEIHKEPFFNPNYISQFISIKDINSSFIEKISTEDNNINYNYQEKMSPREFIEFVDSRIN